MGPAIPKLSILALGVFSVFTTPAIASTTTTLELCVAKEATTSVGTVPTTTISTTLSLTAVEKYTTTPVKTLTPNVVSTTVTSTSTSVKTTTLASTKPTATSTSTVSVTDTITGSAITMNVVDTTTITSTVDASTVPTVSGFTPLASETTYNPKKRSNLFVPRGKGAQLAPRAAAAPTVTISDGTVSCSPTQYPTAVICGEVIEVLTTSTSVITAAASTTTLPVSTSTITKDVTTTSTSTIVKAGTTVTTTSTTTVYTIVHPTTGTTSTSTVTYVPAASTVYAACATDNVVDSANGGLPISGVSVGPYPEDIPSYNTVANITDALDCCVACQTDSNDCGGYLYATGSCMLVEYGSCSPTDFATQFFTDPVVGGGLTIGNGPCGQILNGGPD